MNPRSVRIAAWVAGSALVVSGGVKYVAADRLQGAILGQMPVGLAPSALLAGIIPAMELVIGAGLFLPAWRRTALPWACSLLALLSAWKLLLIARGFTGDCGCLGPLATWPPQATIWLDLALVLLVGAAQVEAQRAYRRDSAAQEEAW